MTRFKSTQSRTASPVVIIYETPAAREHALQFSNQMEQLTEGKPDLCWLPFDRMRDDTAAANAAEQAARAELVVFAVETGGDLPDEIKDWIEHWLLRRGEREGILIGLLEAERQPCAAASLKEIYLRQVAHRAGMDYLSHAPEGRRRPIPDSLESVSARAESMTSVLNDILHARLLQPPIL